ncbi:hypothetical protein BDY17DRAFT_294215 [Neohortaea acidophila]|uniref:Uncharacterized protein n=1 Tax=Neohortaea acidophila TaxID=245834 RepID=A0A6A6Q2V9_9PEZI|nr:uncharacterized protein BDY17DRAFT_294215 [Neohortaea acidophila]KAF2485767.1 hypothetical protein BDY17DRAFT_294215 [Neohortaea acidophila]
MPFPASFIHRSFHHHFTPCHAHLRAAQAMFSRSVHFVRFISPAMLLLGNFLVLSHGLWSHSCRVHSCLIHSSFTPSSLHFFPPIIALALCASVSSSENSSNIGFFLIPVWFKILVMLSTLASFFFVIGTSTTNTPGTPLLGLAACIAASLAFESARAALAAVDWAIAAESSLSASGP